jgi:hypothetical protein
VAHSLMRHELSVSRFLSVISVPQRPPALFGVGVLAGWVSVVPGTGSNPHFCVTAMLVACGRLCERLVEEVGLSLGDPRGPPPRSARRTAVDSCTRAGGMADQDVPATEPIHWHGAGRAWEDPRVADKVAALHRALAPLRPPARSSPSCEPQGGGIEPSAALVTLQPKGRVPAGKVEAAVPVAQELHPHRTPCNPRLWATKPPNRVGFSLVEIEEGDQVHASSETAQGH